MRLRTGFTLLLFLAAPANAMPDLPGTGPADLNVRENTGAAQLSVPIPVPVGTGGFQPRLALEYSSHAGDGPFGVGWRLRLPEVARTTRFGVPAYDDGAPQPTDRFELGGELLVSAGTVPEGERFHLATETFQKVIRSGDAWEVREPNGTVARYGTNASTRIVHGPSGQTARWLLSQLEDVHGNQIDFEWAALGDVGTAYLQRVAYTRRGGAPVGDERRVEFVYEPRPDPMHAYPGGVDTTVSWRVADVQVTVGPNPFRRIWLTYSGSGGYTTHRSRLAAIQVFGDDCAPGVQDPTAPGSGCTALPAQSFTYRDPGDELAPVANSHWASSGAWASPVPLAEPTPEGGSEDMGVRVGDLNADGLPDVVKAFDDDGTFVHQVWINTGSGWANTTEAQSFETSLAALRFMTRAKSGNAWAEVAAPGVPVAFSRRGGWAEDVGKNGHVPPMPLQLVDLNGDGRADLVASIRFTDKGSNTPTGSYASVWINDGSGWSLDPALSTSSLPAFVGFALATDSGNNESLRSDTLPYSGGLVVRVDEGVRLADLNGDRKLDVLARRHYDPSTLYGLLAIPELDSPYSEAWIQSDTGWVAAPAYAPPAAFVGRGCSEYFAGSLDFSARMADLNGDGLADLVKTDPAQGMVCGNGVETPDPEYYAAGVWINTGAGWCDVATCASEQAYLPPEPFVFQTDSVPLATNLIDNALTIVDLNGDGFVDLMQTRGYAGWATPSFRAWLARPDGAPGPGYWQEDTRFEPFAAMESPGWSDGYFPMSRGVAFADVDGDGDLDWIRSYDGETPEAYLGSFAFGDRVAQIDNGRGGVVDVTYASAAAQRDAPLEAEAAADWASMGSPGEPDSGMELWQALPVVAQIVAHDDLDGETFTTTYRYAHPRFCPATESGVGFRVVDTTLHDGSRRKTAYYQQHGIAGRASREEVLDVAGAAVWARDSAWVVLDGSAVPGSATGVNVGRLTTRSSGNLYAGAPGATQTETYTYNDGYGYNFASQVALSRPTAQLTIARTPFVDAVIHGLAATETQSSPVGLLSSETRIHQVGTGLLLERSRLVQARINPQGSQLLTEKWTYDAYGNRRSHEDPLQRTELYCYGGDGQFEDQTACTSGSSTAHAVLTAVKDRLGGVSFFDPDPATGARRSETTWHGDLHAWTLDPFGRQTSYAVTPLGESVTLLETRSYFDGAPTLRAWREVLRETGVDQIRSAEYLDAFGNVVRAARDGANSDTIGTAAVFDHAGRQTYGSYDLACAASDCEGLLPAAPLPPGVTTAFDALGRPLSRANPEGTSYFSYAADVRAMPAGGGPGGAIDVVTHTDAIGNATRRLVDGDRVAWVEECHSGGCASADVTFYVYEGTGEIAEIYDAEATGPAGYGDPRHRLAYRFDTLGRVLSIEDPDGGTSFMAYTATGALASRTNARAQQTTYAYDALDRLTAVVRPDGPAVDVTYDPQTRKRAVVDALEPGGYKLEYSYDALGRRSELVQTVQTGGTLGSGNPFTLRARWEFDLLGRITAIDTPEKDTRFVYVYQGGYLQQVCEATGTESDCATPAATYVQTVTYDSLGRPDVVTTPAGPLDRDFDPLTYRMTRKVLTRQDPSEVLLDFTLGYDYVGNLTSVLDAHDGVASDGFDASATFTYDARNRLASHDLEGTATWFTYDPLGNLTGRSVGSPGITNQTYAHPSKPHAITQGPAGLYAYDADGNLTDRAGQALVWDSDNRLVCADAAGSCQGASFDARYGYDLDGQRLWQRLPPAPETGYDQEFILFEGLAEWDRGRAEAQIHVTAFGRRIATKYLEAPVPRAARLTVPGTPLPFEPGWLLGALAGGGSLWLLVLAIRGGVPARLAERPAAAAVVLLTTGTLVAPPPAWAGGNPGGQEVYRRLLFHDHLGTNVLVTSLGGNPIRRRLFEPFGKVLNQSNNGEPHEQLFTGQRYEASTGLYDFHQRWYDAETGRFTGVDPLVQAPSDPQTINAYGYVRNNPVVHTDSTGMFLDGLVMSAHETGRPVGSPVRFSPKVIATIASNYGPRVASYFFNLALDMAGIGLELGDFAEFMDDTPAPGLTLTPSLSTGDGAPGGSGGSGQAGPATGANAPIVLGHTPQYLEPGQTGVYKTTIDGPRNPEQEAVVNLAFSNPAGSDLRVPAARYQVAASQGLDTAWRHSGTTQLGPLGADVFQVALPGAASTPLAVEVRVVSTGNWRIAVSVFATVQTTGSQ